MTSRSPSQASDPANPEKGAETTSEGAPATLIDPSHVDDIPPTESMSEPFKAGNHTIVSRSDPRELESASRWELHEEVIPSQRIRRRTPHDDKGYLDDQMARHEAHIRLLEKQVREAQRLAILAIAGVALLLGIWLGFLR